MHFLGPFAQCAVHIISTAVSVAAGLLPLETAGAQATALVLGVIFQEGIRYGCFLLHRHALPPAFMHLVS